MKVQDLLRCFVDGQRFEIVCHYLVDVPGCVTEDFLSYSFVFPIEKACPYIDYDISFIKTAGNIICIYVDDVIS